SRFQLIHEGFRYCWTTGSHKNRIVWAIRGPTQRTVETFYGSIVDFQLANSCLGLTRQIANAVDCIDLGRYLRKYCGLITRPSANLQHPAIAIEFEQLRHARYDEWL